MSEVEVARIIKPHGLKGEVGVLMHNERSDLLEHVSEIVASSPDGTKRELRIVRAVPMGRGYRVKFANFDDHRSAEELRGARLLVARHQLPPLPDDETYLVDLIGAEVSGPTGALIGNVIGVQNYPSVDALIIVLPNGKTVEQPWVTDWVRSVDKTSRRIVLGSLDGLV